MTINVAAVGGEALVLGCDSISSVTGWKCAGMAYSDKAGSRRASGCSNTDVVAMFN